MHADLGSSGWNRNEENARAGAGSRGAGRCFGWMRNGTGVIVVAMLLGWRFWSLSFLVVGGDGGGRGGSDIGLVGEEYAFPALRYKVPSALEKRKQPSKDLGGHMSLLLVVVSNML